MKCRYCARTLRVIPHSPVEIEPHCQRRGCLWCAECFRGETPVSPAFESNVGTLRRMRLPYRARHRRPEPGPGREGERAA